MFWGIILGSYLLASCGSQPPGFSSQHIESTRLALLLALYGHQASGSSTQHVGEGSPLQQLSSSQKEDLAGSEARHLDPAVPEAFHQLEPISALLIL